MAGTMNKVILVGRLGQDPKLAYTAAGKAVANFTMATDESYTDQQGTRQERTEWHRVVCWGKTAELVDKYLGKGRLVLVEGKIQTRQYDDKDGNKRFVTEVVAKQQVQFLDKAPEGAQTGQQPAPAQGREEDLGPAYPTQAGEMDDVPF